MVCYHLSYKIMGAGGSAGGGTAHIGIGIHSGSVEKTRASGVHFTSRRMIFYIQNAVYIINFEWIDESMMNLKFNIEMQNADSQI